MTARKKRISPHKSLLARARPHYDWLLNVQDGVCAICGRPPVTRRLDIDHCHSGLYIRGLLCHRCNRALPSWVTVDWLERATRYLQQPPVVLPQQTIEEGEEAA